MGVPVAIYGAERGGQDQSDRGGSLLAPGRGLRGAASEEMARRPEAIGWKIAAAVPGHEIVTWSEGAGRPVEIDGKIATQTGLGGCCGSSG